ncbi:MAG: TerD family protein [Oscillospiraceae bacterium]|nr:TerD family protein [Oscillospiraceae bacterium]
MSVKLKKGQRISLSKESGGLKNVMVGLGWDEAQSGGGFLSIFKSVQNIDCDASAVLLCDDKLVNNDDVVYYGNLNHMSGCVIHQGDNLTGEGEGDDEQICVSLERLPERYNKIVVIVNIYEAKKRSQHFGMINNAFIRIVDTDAGKELCKYNLTDDYSDVTGVIFGEIYRHGGEWKFGAIGEGVRDDGLGDIIKRFR